MIENISQISDHFDGILLDAYGVFWGGNDFGALPDSQEAMERLVAQGKIVGILSNTTQLSGKEIKKLKDHGFIQGKHFHFLVTSGDVGRAIFLNKSLPFETPSNKYYLYCGDHPKFSSHEAIFHETVYTETKEVSEADFIYISVPHIKGEDQLDPQVFAREIQALKEINLPVVCPNPDRFAHEGKPPRSVVRQGCIAALFEEMGAPVFYIGKPYQSAFAAAMKCFQEHHIEDAKKILMVGDTPETDIRGGHLFGMSTALISKSGIMADRISKSNLEEALKALPKQDVPDFIIGTL